MSNIDKQALREVAEKATKGELWSDVIETEGEYGEGEDRVSGYHSYAVYVGHESLLDMTNSTAACIHTEWDHDYHMAWDETAKRNAEFIAAANPATVLALLDELEAKDKLIAELTDSLKQTVSGYKSCLRTGHDRILDLGGGCDSPEVMIAGNPDIQQAEKLLAAAAAKGE
ncbi:ead/Ea22-like family protein [Enterobacter roggenkampii]|uniref:ead/Ea22-like family protein n=1 Tax=Enterobacter roggenkampii TaxID=1812935 RepID=UPI001658F178|nr:ead/Ea22-like family protein [Enterobacter roggenkampii]QNQ23533.1 ead/Ea22-like family protein [Enterobacter roggenkampii]